MVVTLCYRLRSSSLTRDAVKSFFFLLLLLLLFSSLIFLMTDSKEMKGKKWYLLPLSLPLRFLTLQVKPLLSIRRLSPIKIITPPRSPKLFFYPLFFFFLNSPVRILISLLFFQKNDIRFNFFANSMK